MASPAGESNAEAIRLDFDRRLTAEFRGPTLASNAGSLPYCKLDDAPGFIAMAGETRADALRQHAAINQDRLEGESIETGQTIKPVLVISVSLPHRTVATA